MRGTGVASGAWLGLLAVAALIFVAGGPVVVAVPVLAWLAWRPTRGRGRAIDPAGRLPLVALVALVVSGLLCAVRPFGEGVFGPFGWPSQACALVALAAALMPTVPARYGRRPEARDATVPASAGKPTDGEGDG